MKQIVYTLATSKQAARFNTASIKWFDEERGNEMFDSTHLVTKMAVAEYLANQEGRTLYTIKTLSPKEV